MVNSGFFNSKGCAVATKSEKEMEAIALARSKGMRLENRVTGLGEVVDIYRLVSGRLVCSGLQSWSQVCASLEVFKKNGH